MSLDAISLESMGKMTVYVFVVILLCLKFMSACWSNNSKFWIKDFIMEIIKIYFLKAY